MIKILIKLPSKYSLYDTLYPSFIYSFFKYNNEKLVKIVGFYSNVIFYLRNNIVDFCYRKEIPRKIIEEWLGLWFNPNKYIDCLSSNEREIAEVFVKYYGQVRLSISTCDKDYVFVSVFLSQNTNFHINTVKWIRKLVSIYGSEFLKKDIYFSIIGNSYQLKKLDNIFKKYRRIGDFSDPGFLRLNLLSIKWVGPKIADAFILFSSRNSESVPCDIHLKRFMDKLGLVAYKRLPAKNYCSKYYCWFDTDCPIRDDCLRYLVMNRFKKLSGWIQTISYIHDKKFCSKKLCKDCYFKTFCKII